METTELVKMRTRAILDFLTNNPAYQLTSREWLVFLTIAMDEGVSTPELVMQLGIPQQTLSRTIRNLALVTSEDGELMGFNLIRSVPLGKAYSFYLTAEGETLWSEFGVMHKRVDEKVIVKFQGERAEMEC